MHKSCNRAAARERAMVEEATRIACGGVMSAYGQDPRTGNDVNVEQGRRRGNATSTVDGHAGAVLESA